MAPTSTIGMSSLIEFVKLGLSRGAVVARGALIAHEVPAGAGEGWSVGTAAARGGRLLRLEGSVRMGVTCPWLPPCRALSARCPGGDPAGGARHHAV